MLDLTNRCPSWCAHHEHETDDLTVHTAVTGFAGPLEVSLACWVMADQPDPVTELQIRNLGDTSARAEPITLPIDTDVDQLGELLREAVRAAQD